jgi:hypothetical protein
MHAIDQNTPHPGAGFLDLPNCAKSGRHRRRSRRESTALAVRETLPLSTRTGLDNFLGLPPHRLLSTLELVSAGDLIPKLREAVDQAGGAPTVYHTGEGERYSIGGTEDGERIQHVLENLAELLRKAWRVSDRLAAQAAIEALKRTSNGFDANGRPS